MASLLKKEAVLTQESYYEASVVRAPALQALRGAVTVNVCIVGGGCAGLSAALELAARGYTVAVLEAQRVGWGASGRNGGQAIVGYGFAGEDAIAAQLPAEDAKCAWNISVEGMQLLRERINQHAIHCDYVPGYMHLAVNERKALALQGRTDHMARAYGYPMQAIGASAIGNWIASKRFHAGVFDPQSGHLHPLKYCLGLADAAHAIKVQVFENSTVTHLERGSKPVVKTARGQVTCDFVLLACNAYLGEYGNTIAPELSKRIMPVGTYIIATEPMAKERADLLIRHRAAVSDTNLILDYFRVSADHRLLFGGGESHSTATPRNLATRIRRRMLQVFPQLADLSVTHAWGGFVDITLNQAPDFGRTGNNIYYLQGFSGHGLALTGMAGKLVAEAISGQAERFDLLARIKHRPFPGGALLRMPALVLGMLYYRLRDLL